MNFAQKKFVEMFEAATKVDFDVNWRNGTGYYNGATKVAVPAGEIWASEDEAPNSRRILLIGTIMGTFVVFERYTPGLNSPFVLVSNKPKAGNAFLRDGALEDFEVINLKYLNDTIEGVYSAIQKNLEKQAA